MRKIVFFIFLFAFSINAFAQNENSQISLSFLFGRSTFNDMGGMTWIGGDRNDNETGNNYGVGIDYQYKLSKYFDVCTGIVYSKLSLDPLLGSEGYRDCNVNLYSIPVAIIYNFYRLFFVMGGASFDVSKYSEIDTYRCGFGLNLAVGVQHTFYNKINIFASPYIQINIFPDKYYLSNNFGLKIGIGYRF